LADGNAQAVMNVDAILFAPDKKAALRELARIEPYVEGVAIHDGREPCVCIREYTAPGGRLLVTIWDYHTQPVRRLPQLSDHRPVLAEAGCEVLAYDETDSWRERPRRTSDLLLGSVEELAAERGDHRDEVRAGIEATRATNDHMTRRVLIVAERR
jgi:hypothetical protein